LTRYVRKARLARKNYTSFSLRYQKKLAPRALFAAAAATAATAAAAGAFDPYSRMTFPNRVGLPLFDAAKFGLFIHWGPISQWGTEISFPLVCYSFPCTVSGANQSSIVINSTAELAAHRQAYRDLASTFNPTAFNATALAELAYAAGFRYVTPTAVHCDGFSLYNTSKVNAAYSMAATPFQRDVTGEIFAAFKAKGMRTGIYICPSFWNSDDYWAPNALTSFGGCCQPNYNPSDPSNAPVWSRFVSYLHSIISEIRDAYKPDHWWFDSGTYPSDGVDTHIEQLVPSLRAANPEAVLHVRDGGIYHDYVEPNDHSEAVVDAILGLTYASSGDKFEVPGTLGEQWAFDPKATYKDAATCISELVNIAAKGGNYLLNVGLDPTGVWAPAAVDTLKEMATWFAYAAESVHGTSPTWPYEYNQQLFTASTSSPYTYVFWSGGVRADGTVLVIPYKPSVLASLPAAVRALVPGGPVTLPFTIDEFGLAVNVSAAPASSASGLVPLTTFFRVYSAVQWDNAPCATRDCSVYSGDSYAATFVEGSCVRPGSAAAAAAAASAEPMVSISLFYNGGLDNVGVVTAPTDGQPWSKVDVECLAFVNSASNRWPLEIWHNAAVADYWTLANPASRANATAAGYTLYASLGFVSNDVKPALDALNVLRIEWL
jgi:alpha-L-fucosidase